MLGRQIFAFVFFGAIGVAAYVTVHLALRALGLSAGFLLKWAIAMLVYAIIIVVGGALVRRMA
jgi:hypothetical protein